MAKTNASERERAGKTLKERFHSMQSSDPLFFTFSDIWTRIQPDRSIGFGLYLVDAAAEESLKCSRT